MTVTIPILFVISLVIIVFYNPVKSNDAIVEVALYDSNSEPIYLCLSQDQSSIVIQTIKNCRSIRTLVLKKTEYACPGVYHIRTATTHFFVGKDNGKPIIHCSRFTGNLLVDGEWTLFPSEEQYEIIMKQLNTTIQNYKIN